MTSVGSGSRGMSWMVYWTTFASVEAGVTKRRPMRKMSRMWAPNRPEMMPQPGVNLISLNRKKTSQTAAQKMVVMSNPAIIGALLFFPRLGRWRL